MNSGEQHIQESFKKILSTLPEDKKRELYERVKSAPPEKRNELIRTIVERYDKSRRPVIRQPQVTRADFMSREEKKPEKKNRQWVNIVVYAVAAVVILAGVFTIIWKGYERVNRGEPQVSENITSSSAVATETPTPSPSPTPTPTVTPTPEPTLVPISEDAPDLSGLTVVIDPGHQQDTSSEYESCANWLSVQKPRATSGSVGTNSGEGEYQVTMEISDIIRCYLEQCGATVILTRSDNDVDISNQERAQIALDNNADFFIRIHADGANDARLSGIQIYAPDSGSYTSNSTAWADELGSLLSEATGTSYNGCRLTYLYTGLNYASSIPSLQVSLGYLTNGDDETMLLDEETRVRIASAFAEFLAGRV